MDQGVKICIEADQIGLLQWERSDGSKAVQR